MRLPRKSWLGSSRTSKTSSRIRCPSSCTRSGRRTTRASNVSSRRCRRRLMSMLLITIGRLRDGGKAALERYGEAVIPLISAAGGEVVGRGNPQETVVGDDRGRPDLIALIRFPNADTIRQFLAS